MLDAAQVRPVVPCGNRLVFQSSGLHGSSCVVLPLAENLQPRRQTCWEHLLSSLPLFFSLLPSLHSSLVAFSPESVTAFSFICIYFSPPFIPPLPLLPFGFIPPSLHPRFLTSPLCPITGVTAVELSKHSLRCRSTLHTVMCRLCVTQDVVRMTLLGWHVLPEDIMFTLFVLTGNRHLHHA